jgi:DNA-binding transcriptional regulator YiaG
MTAAEFRDLERRLDLSKRQTALLCGVTPDAVARWRRGQTAVPFYAARLLTLEAERRAQTAQETRPS